MKKIITASNNLALLQRNGKDEKAKKIFHLLADKDKRDILNTISILHGDLFCEIFLSDNTVSK